MSQIASDPIATQLVPDTAIRRRAAAERGQADHGWLKSSHSFSFAGYHDPAHTHFHALRVINDDQVAPGRGFPMHPHQDFEIFSYVLDGAIAHEDSLGNGSTVTAGGVQYMSAGRGVTHSEFNPSTSDPVHFLQIWLIPEVRGVDPRYDVRQPTAAAKRGKLALFISEDGRDGTINSYAAAEVYAGLFDSEECTDFDVAEGRAAYVHVARGTIDVNGQRLGAGDAIAVSATGRLTLSAGEAAEVLLFDLKAGAPSA